MYPEPLIGISSDELFDLGGICGSRRDYIGLAVAGISGLDDSAAYETVLFRFGVPDTERGKDQRI